MNRDNLLSTYNVLRNLPETSLSWPNTMLQGGSYYHIDCIAWGMRNSWRQVTQAVTGRQHSKTPSDSRVQIPHAFRVSSYNNSFCLLIKNNASHVIFLNKFFFLVNLGCTFIKHKNCILHVQTFVCFLVNIR